MEINQELLQYLLNLANEVKQFPAELQAEAFRILATGNSNRTENKTNNETPSDLKGLDLLSNKLDISIEDLKTIYRITDDGKLTIVYPIKGKKPAILRMVAYLYLIYMTIVEKKEYVKFSEITNIVSGTFNADDGNMIRSIKTETGKIILSGKSKAVDCKLTPNGIVEAKNKIKELLNQK